MALAIGGCGSPSESDTTGQADLPAADLLPFPTAAPPNQRVALVSRFSEPDLEWGGRRSGEQATHVTMLSGGGEEPVFVSARPAAPDEYPELTDEPIDGRPALVVLKPGEPFSGVPQDAPVVSVRDDETMVRIAQRGASAERLRELAAGITATSDGEVDIDDDLGLSPAGHLAAGWAAPEGGLAVGFNAEETEDPSIDQTVSIRRIDHDQAAVLLGLANRDPESSLRTAASVEDAETFKTPETVEVAGTEATVATVASGFRALIAPDLGFAIFSYSNTPVGGFLTGDSLVSIAEGVEFVDADELERRATVMQHDELARVIGLIANPPDYSGQWKTRLIWDNGATDPFLALTEVDEGGVTHPALTRVQLVDGQPEVVGIEFLEDTDGPLAAGITSRQAPSRETQQVVGGIAPPGTSTIEATVDGVAVTTEVIPVGAEGIASVFIVDVDRPTEGLEFGNYSVKALGDDGSTIASYEYPPDPLAEPEAPTPGG